MKYVFNLCMCPSVFLSSFIHIPCIYGFTYCLYLGSNKVKLRRSKSFSDIRTITKLELKKPTFSHLKPVREAASSTLGNKLNKEVYKAPSNGNIYIFFFDNCNFFYLLLLYYLILSVRLL